MTAEIRPIDAVHALRDRGVDDAEALLEGSTPEIILATCRWWDKQKNAQKGLLIWKLRQGGPEEPAIGVKGRLRAIWDEYAARIPVGHVCEPHLRLQERRGYITDGDNPCTGSLVVIDQSYPIWTLECDKCGYTAGLTARNLHLIGKEKR